MMNYTKYVLGGLLSFCMVSESFAISSGFISNEVPSARAAGQGYVGIAGQNDDPTAVYTNPAAMTALRGTQATLGIHWENVHGSYQDNAGAETKERVTNVAVPNFSVTQNFMDGKLAAGLSAQSPYGLETHWDANSPLGIVATNSVLHMVDITPAIAYQVHPMVSIGAGADYMNLFDAQLDSQLGPVITDLRGQGANWGYHAGVVIQPSEQHSIGIVYHSKVDLRVNGHLSVTTGLPSPFPSMVTTSAYTDLVLPENVQFGYSYKPTDRWMLEADTAWYHWSSTKDLNIRFPVSGASSIESLDLRDVWSFATGANYKLTSRWQLRGGFWYEPSVVSDADFTAAFMDLPRYGISTGAGYAITDSLTVDAAYTAVFMHNRTINNGLTPGGTYSDFANLVALNVTYRFGAGK